MIKPFLAAALATITVMGAARADTLQFTLQGTNPDGRSHYRGTVALSEVALGAHGDKSGTVTWTVNGAAPVRGVAMSNEEAPGRLSISFPGKPVPGVALGQFTDSGDVRVVWYVGGETAGTEIWTRRR